MSETNGKSALKKYTKNLKEKKIDIDDQVYTLREMTGLARDKWRNDQKKRIEVSKDGQSATVRDHRNVQAELITLCLFDPSGQPVPVDEIAQWPSSLQEDLFQECQTLNTLTAEAIEEAKKG